MIKRPINARFREKVVAGIKVTTIRAKAWPQRVPIMLYSWSGKPYASKHEDLCAVRVNGAFPVVIKKQVSGEISYRFRNVIHFGVPLWSLEGFENQQEMDEWFGEKLKEGEEVEMQLMFINVVDGF
jgi:hypothetical protein